MPAPPTQPIRPSTTTNLRWSMCPSWWKFHCAALGSCPVAPGRAAAWRARPEPRRLRPESLVERAARPIGVGALPVDDEPDGNAFAGLRDQRLGEPLPDDARPESELVDVDGRGRGLDVLEHRRIEVLALDVHLGGRGDGLVELEREVPTVGPVSPQAALPRLVAGSCRHRARILAGTAHLVAGQVAVPQVVERIADRFAGESPPTCR